MTRTPVLAATILERGADADCAHLIVASDSQTLLTRIVAWANKNEGYTEDDADSYTTVAQVDVDYLVTRFPLSYL